MAVRRCVQAATAAGLLVQCPWGCSYTCRVSAKLEAGSSCPCIVFVQRFFRSVSWPPAFAALTACLGGARSVLVQLSCWAGEQRSLQVGRQGDGSLGAEGCNSMSSCRRGSPLLIGVRSEHKLSTDHIPILYRTGKPEHAPPRGTTFQTHSDPVYKHSATQSCVFWNTYYALSIPSVH